MSRPKKNNDAIIADILKSPDKCRDAEIAQKHGLSKSRVRGLRQEYTDIRFVRGSKRYIPPCDFSEYHNYLQELNEFKELLACKIAHKNLIKQGYDISLQDVIELGRSTAPQETSIKATKYISSKGLVREGYTGGLVLLEGGGRHGRLRSTHARYLATGHAPRQRAEAKG